MSSKSFTLKLWLHTAPLHAFAFSLFIFLSISDASAQTAVTTSQSSTTNACPENWVAILETAEGKVQASPIGSDAWQDLAIGDCILEHSQVQVIDGRATLSLTNNTLLRASSDTIIEFASPTEKRSWISLLKGWLHFLSRTPAEFEVETPYVNAGVKGTEFSVSANSDTQSSFIAVLEGNILADDGTNAVSIDGGYEARFQQGQDPSTFRINDAKDIVQWTLYYPPLLVSQNPNFEAAREQLLNSNYLLAANTLETVPDNQRNSDYYSLFSSLNLFRGDVAQAEQDIENALNQTPNYSPALALRGVILLTKSDLDAAESVIHQAIDSAANSQERANALLAQSYLLQAQFELEQSLEAINSALQQQPANALLLSRQAELALMLDRYALADSASQQAVQLQPTLAHAHTTRGFVLLQGLKLNEAKASFEQAIRLGSSDPLPHLGLGLIAIRNNDLDAGRHQFELAAVLDPGHSLVRSYLGKAYFTEDRDKLAATQYTLAGQMDPNDPTPWLYRAILEQNNNRPFAALAALNKSIEMNDNRAVYRSRFNLDRDEAARMSRQGQIYKSLGLDDEAERIASESITTSPADSSGHLLLAQSYADDIRLDEARVSEMFQAQINQPLSARPLLSMFSEPDLSVSNGIEASELGYNEYSNLFNRNSNHAEILTGAGNHNSHTNAVILSGLYNSWSLSAGYYDYRTDGFEEGADVEHEIFNIFAQYQVSTNWDLQFEVVVKESLIGSVEQSLIEPDIADENTRQLSDTTTYRFNSNYRPSASGNFYASVSLTDHKVDQASLFSFRDENNTPIILDYRSTVELDNSNRELDLNLRYDHKFDSFLLSSGVFAGQLESQNTIQAAATVTITPPPPQPPSTIDIPISLPIVLPNKFVSQYFRVYSYLSTNLSESLQLTVGGSYDTMEMFTLSPETHREFNPKIGLTWEFLPTSTFRVAAARNANFNNFGKHGLEPTTISNTNQIIDNKGGTSTDIASVSYDYTSNSNWDFGVEAVNLNSRIPNQSISDFTEVDHQELKLYSNLTLDPFAVSISYSYDAIETDSNLNNGLAQLDEPIEYTLHKAPIQLRYHSEIVGSFIVGANFVRQKGIFLEGSASTSLHREVVENFTTLDIGYEKYFLNNNLTISLSARNITDKEFRIEDLVFLDPSRRMIELMPARSIFASIRMSLD